MPNHCSNYLTVKGNENDISRFYEAITVRTDKMREHEEFSILDNLYPTPKELADTPSGSFEPEKQKWVDEQILRNREKYGCDTWYEWNIQHYGSKWSDYDGHFGEISPTELNMSFVSAWSPISNGIAKVSSLFPELNFILSYEEGGMAFIGACAYRNGELVADIEGVYPEMTEEEYENEDYESHYERLNKYRRKLEVVCEELLKDMTSV